MNVKYIDITTYDKITVIMSDGSKHEYDTTGATKIQLVRPDSRETPPND